MIFDLSHFYYICYMEKLTSNRNFFLISGLILAAVIFRIIPHPFNITPIIAVALFAGAKFKDKKWAIIIPIASLFISDVILSYVNHYELLHSTILFTYGSVLLIILLGRLLNNDKLNISKTIGLSLLSSLLFFLISNFGVWLFGNLYTLDIAGLAKCYIMAIPFNKFSWAGDLFFVFALFGIYEFISNKNTSESKEMAWLKSENID